MKKKKERPLKEIEKVWPLISNPDFNKIPEIPKEAVDPETLDEDEEPENYSNFDKFDEQKDEILNK